MSESDSIKTYVTYGGHAATSHPRRSIVKINTYESTHAVSHNKSPNSSAICSNSISMKISSKKCKVLNDDSAIDKTSNSATTAAINVKRFNTTSYGVSTTERKLYNRDKLLNTNGTSNVLSDKNNFIGDNSVKDLTKKMGSMGSESNILDGDSNNNRMLGERESQSFDKGDIKNGIETNKNTKMKLPLRRSSVATSEPKGIGRKSIVSMFETIAAEESISRKKSEFVKRKPSSQYYHELDQLVQQKESVLKEKVGECPQRKASLFSYLSENKNIKNGDSTVLKTSDEKTPSTNEPASRRASLAVGYSSQYSTKDSHRPRVNDFSPINEEKKEISSGSTNGHSTRKESVINRIPEIPDIIEDVESNDTFSELPSSSVRLKNSETNGVNGNEDNKKEQNNSTDVLSNNDETENTNNKRRNSKVYGKARRTSKSDLQFSGQRRSVVDMFENIAAEENINKKKSEFVRKRSSAQYYKELEEIEEHENKTRRASLMMVGSSRRDIEKEKSRRTSLMTLSNSELKRELEIENKERRSSLMNMNILDSKRKEIPLRNINFEKTTGHNISDRRKSEGDLKFPTQKPSNVPRGGSISSISEEGKKVGELLESEADLYSALEKDLHRITADVSTVKSDINVFSNEVQRKASLGSFSPHRSESMYMGYKNQQPKLQTFDEAYSSASDSEEIPNQKSGTHSENSDTDSIKNSSISKENRNSIDKEDLSLRKTNISRKNAVVSMPGPITKTYSHTGRIDKISLIEEEEGSLPHQSTFENDSFYSSSASESEKLPFSSYSDSSGKQSAEKRKGVSEDENEVLFRTVQNKIQTNNSNNIPNTKNKIYSSSESDSDGNRKESVVYKPSDKKTIISKEPLSRKSTNEDKKTVNIKEPLSRKSTNEDKKTNVIKEPLSRKSTNDDKKTTIGKESLSRKSTLTNEDRNSMYTKEALSRKSTLTDENTIALERKKTLTPNNPNDFEETKDLSLRKENLRIDGLQCYEETNKPWIEDWFSARCELGSPSVAGPRLLCLDDLRQKRSYKDEVQSDELDSDSELEMRQRYPVVNQLDIYEDLRSEGMEVVADKETRDIITDTLSAFDDHELSGNLMFHRKLGSENETDSDSNSTVISGDDGKSSVVLGTKNNQCMYFHLFFQVMVHLLKIHDSKYFNLLLYNTIF